MKCLARFCLLCLARVQRWQTLAPILRSEQYGRSQQYGAKSATASTGARGLQLPPLIIRRRLWGPSRAARCPCHGSAVRNSSLLARGLLLALGTLAMPLCTTAPVLAQAPNVNIPSNSGLSGTAWLEDYVKLSDAVYHYNVAEVDGWMKLPDKSGFDAPTGVQWAVYQRSLGNDRFEEALVFAGTQGGAKAIPDWENNLAQGANMTPLASQYRKATEIAEAEFKSIPRDTSFVIVGHSLGGGLTEFAAGFLGVRGITINGAPLSPESQHEIAEHWISDPVTMITLPAERYLSIAGLPNREMSRIEGPLLNAVGQNIVNVSTYGEPLQKDVGFLGASHIGARSITVMPAPGTPTDPISLHMPDSLIKGIEYANPPRGGVSPASDFQQAGGYKPPPNTSLQFNPSAPALYDQEIVKRPPFVNLPPPLPPPPLPTALSNSIQESTSQLMGIQYNTPPRGGVCLTSSYELKNDSDFGDGSPQQAPDVQAQPPASTAAPDCTPQDKK